MIDSLPVVKFLRDATIARQYQKVEKSNRASGLCNFIALLNLLCAIQ